MLFGKKLIDWKRSATKPVQAYSWYKAKKDAYAGLQVALVDLPQAIAYAMMAGFPVFFGLYASIIGSVVGPIFSKCRHLVIGPTNGTAVLILSAFLALGFTDEEKFIALPVLVFLVGAFILLGACLKVGTLVKYVSRSVIAGYITAAVCFIIANQLDSILGLKDLKAVNFFDMLHQVALALGQTQWTSAAIAGLCAFFYIILGGFDTKIPTLVLACALTSLCTLGAAKFLGIAAPTLEAFEYPLPHFAWPKWDFELIYQLGSTAVAIAFLCTLEVTSIAKAMFAKSGEKANLNLPLVSLGMSNVVSGCFSGMPISGSLTRSNLSYTNGAQTFLSTIYSGIILFSSLLLARYWLPYLPKPALSMLIILVTTSIINLKQIQQIVFASPADAAVFFLTFLSGLFFPLSVAISLGTLVSIVLFLHKVSEPQLVQYNFNDSGEPEEKVGLRPGKLPEISMIHVDGELFFGSTDIFTDQMKLLYQSPQLKVLILRLRNATCLDATSALAINDLVNFAKKMDRHFIISGANEQVERVLRVTHVMEAIGEENFFRHNPERPNLPTRLALQQAQNLIGQEKAKIRLFRKSLTTVEE